MEGNKIHHHSSKSNDENEREREREEAKYEMELYAAAKSLHHALFRHFLFYLVLLGIYSVFGIALSELIL